MRYLWLFSGTKKFQSEISESSSVWSGSAFNFLQLCFRCMLTMLKKYVVYCGNEVSVKISYSFLTLTYNSTKKWSLITYRLKKDYVWNIYRNVLKQIPLNDNWILIFHSSADKEPIIFIACFIFIIYIKN